MRRALLFTLLCASCLGSVFCNFGGVALLLQGDSLRGIVLMTACLFLSCVAYITAEEFLRS
jgi:hypothetical protein